MIWNNPWAWAGLLSLAVPVLVHLLGRRRPTPLPFPSLRFLTETRLVPARRHRLNDIPLMLVRAAILLLAVAALAQPAFFSAAPTSRLRARAVIVDASASMNRPTANGQTALAAARARAAVLTEGATSSQVIESASLRDALAGATAWLEGQPGVDELVIVSDLQTGTVTRADLSGVPAHIGLVLEAIDVAAGEPPASIVDRPTGAIEMRMQVGQEGTTAVWQPAPGDVSVNIVTVLAGSADRVAADAAISAARTEGKRTGTTTHPFVVVLPSATDRQALATRARPIDAPWMFDIVRALASDPTVVWLARASVRANTAPAPATASPIVRDSGGAVLLAAATEDVSGSARLALFADVDPQSALFAAIIATASQAAAGATPASELDPGRIPADEWKSWQRAPSAPPISRVADRTRSDGRWLWAGVLLLLALEMWMRRGAAPGVIVPKGTEGEVDRARVA